MVTVAVQDIDYEAPVYRGEIVEFDASVVEADRTLGDVEVEMHAEALLTGERRRCGNGRFIFVAQSMPRAGQSGSLREDIAADGGGGLPPPPSATIKPRVGFVLESSLGV